tara:strand:+ start:60 stop:365 length:306 start_codon:yes stop_codon:yes gene_type:complete
VTFIKLGEISDIPNGTVKLYHVNNREIAICNANGEIYAVDNMCTHEEGSLEEGELENCELECPLHGARFDVRNGEVMQGPAVMPLDTFEVRITNNTIEVKV